MCTAVLVERQAPVHDAVGTDPLIAFKRRYESAAASVPATRKETAGARR
jgi:hypothetical protein